MPTSRYCDHARCSIRTSFSRAASGEPGRTADKLSPMTATIERRTASAFAGSPRACSSMTRSSMLDTNVTPLALIACRSQGASSHGKWTSRSRSDELASIAARSPMRGSDPMLRIAMIGSSRSSRSRTVGARCDRSQSASSRTRATIGPATAGDHTRPISVACDLSTGRHWAIVRRSLTFNSSSSFR